VAVAGRPIFRGTQKLTNESRPTEVSQNDEPLFSRGVSLLLRHFRLFLLLAFVGGVAGIAVSYLFTPVFRVDALLVPSDEILGLNQNSLLGGVGGLASLVGIGGSGSKESEALAILKSRALTSAYIQENELLPIIFHDRWNSDTHKWKSDKKGQVPTLEDGFTVFDKSIRSVVENRKTGLITVLVTWRDPKLAKQWADGLVHAANDLLRRQAIERSANNLEYLQKVLDKTSVVTMKDTISKLMETELKKQMMATGNSDYAFRVVDPAVVPERKFFPKRSIFAVFGSAFGCIIWISVVAFRNPKSAVKPT
jgi:uncharacterized protein involved in exopolysaccharide biosynthesis